MKTVKICMMAILFVSVVTIAQAQQSVFQGTWIEEDSRNWRLEISGTAWSYFINDVIQGAGTAKFSTGSAELLLANGSIYFELTLLAPGLIQGGKPYYEPYRFRISVSALIRQGIEKIERGDYDGAIADYTQAIRLDPNNANAYGNRGIAYGEKGDYDRAIADYNQAIRLDPNDPAAYYNRGIAYRRNGDYDRAIADYTQAIRLDPNDPAAYYFRGAAYNRKGDYDHAIADYTEVIRLDPNEAGGYYNRGTAYSRKGDYDRAIADFEAALRINPNNADARRDLESVRQRRGR